MEKTIILDFCGCETVADIHSVLKEGLGFPEWYGKNWDAFWDMGCDYIPLGARLCLKGLCELPEELGDEARVLLGILLEIKTECNRLMSIEF